MSIEKFLVDRNIARNKKQAEGLMIAVIVACLLFIGINLFVRSSPSVPELTPEEIAEFEAEFGVDFDNEFPEE